MPGAGGAASHVSCRWIPLKNRFYRRTEQYSQLEWSLNAKDLNGAIVGAAPCAGPIAVIPEAGWGLSYALAIFSLSGRLIHRYEHLRDRKVPPFRAIAVGWSNADLLSIVYNDGVILRIPTGLHIYELRKVLVDSALSKCIYDAAIANNGDVALRADDGEIYYVDQNDNVVKEKQFVKPPEGVSLEIPNCGIAIASCMSSSSQSSPEILLITERSKVVLISSYGLSYMPGDREMACIAVSENGQYVVSMEAESSTIFVFTVDLRTEIAHIDLGVELSVLGVENLLSDHVFDASRPESIAWIGSDAIAVLYREQLAIVGPHGAVAVLPLDEHFEGGGVITRQEVDGLRLVSSSCVNFVQMVPESVRSSLRETNSVAHKLLRSSGGSLEESSQSRTSAIHRYRLLRELRDNCCLRTASRICVAAAYLETNVAVQKELVRAAAHGQRHASVFNEPVESQRQLRSRRPDEPDPSANRKQGEVSSMRDAILVPAAIAILRVLNAASSFSAGIPLSKPQFDVLGLARLVSRLSRYGRHSLAIRLAAFGGISPSDVLSEWAACAIRTSPDQSDEALADLIIDNFETIRRSNTTVSLHGSMRNRAPPYVNAAEAAFSGQRLKCAEFLLRKETRPAPKVAMYLKMEREAPAIAAAVASGDPELVLHALTTILKKKKVRETARLLRSLPPVLGTRATDLFATHLKQIGDLVALRGLFIETGRRREAALVDIYQAERIENPLQRLEELKRAAIVFGKGQGRKSCYFEAHALRHAVAVASNALEVEKRGKLEAGTLRYASAGDLLARAISDVKDPGRRRELLVKLRKEMRVPDRRFFWVCLHSMAEVGDFESIENLSHSAGYGRAPPIGLTAFVDTCVKYHMDDEAVKYAMRITDLRERARALARCGHGREAADIASRLRNQQLLEEVQDFAARHVAHIAILSDKSSSTTSS